MIEIDGFGEIYSKITFLFIQTYIKTLFFSFDYSNFESCDEQTVFCEYLDNKLGLMEFFLISVSFQLVNMDRDDDDFGEGFIAESHPLRPTLSSQLSVPLGRNDSRAPSISSSVSDLDAPIYTRETTIPVRHGVSQFFIQIPKFRIE